MAVGTVKWSNSRKGYGFIAPNGIGPDVFMHISALERAGLSNLNEGPEVEYETEIGKTGHVGSDQSEGALIALWCDDAGGIAALHSIGD